MLIYGIDESKGYYIEIENLVNWCGCVLLSLVFSVVKLMYCGLEFIVNEYIKKFDKLLMNDLLCIRVMIIFFLFVIFVFVERLMIEYILLMFEILYVL